MILYGDNKKVMKAIRDNTIDCILCDPPYALVSGCMTRPRPDLADYVRADTGKVDNPFASPQKRGGFMGKSWDSKLPEAQTWTECYRVLKPGAFILVMASPRNDDLVSISLREAGFIKHNSIYWVYGSGFPKGRSVEDNTDQLGWAGYRYGLQSLKPAAEVVLVFQKPFDGSPLESILKWGVGAVNVDAGRIGTADDTGRKASNEGPDIYNKGFGPQDTTGHGQGRYPSNFILSHAPGCRVVGERRVKGTNISHDRGNINYTGIRPAPNRPRGLTPLNYADADGKETVKEYECEENCPVRELDRQSGVLATHSTGQHHTGEYGSEGITGWKAGAKYSGDTGTASRFFAQPEWGPADFYYCAKSSSAERGRGCEDIFWEKVGGQNIRVDRERWEQLKPEDRGQGNGHPTCKPISLAQYLIKLFRGNNDSIILDPFAGSGWVEIACILEGCKSISIEAEWEYVIIGEARSVYWKQNKKNYLTEGTMPTYQPDLPLFEK